MPTSLCRACGATIQALTSESTGGFCFPCAKWFQSAPDEAETITREGTTKQLAAFRQHCLGKVGATRDPLEANDYRILAEFLGSFASLVGRGRLPVVLLRCKDHTREQLQASTHAVRLSDRMHWSNLDGWNWTEVLLDGSLDEALLRDLIDDSYELARESLDDEKKLCLELLAKELPPEELLDELLKKFGLSRRRDQILAAARSAFLACSSAADDGVPIGISKLGGLPGLPGGVDWPTYEDGRPLAFLSQLNLSELPADSELPGSGMLWFFSVFGWQTEDEADPQLPGKKYDNSWTKVFYSEATSEELKRISPPSDVTLYGEARLEFFSMTCLPAIANEQPLAKLKWNSETKAKYGMVVSNYNMACLQRRANPARNLVLGYADFLERFVRKVAKDDLQLLFQLASDPNAKMSWGDDGYIYFWIAKKDLAVANFSQILTDYQCA